MLQRPGQVLLRFFVIQTRQRCFCRWQSAFVPALYRKSKKRSASLNESLDSGTVGRKSNNAVFALKMTEEEPPKPPPDEDEPKPPIEEPPTEEPPVKEPPPKNN